jgi:dihydroneopterin aldolase
VNPQPVLINITVFTDTRRAARSKDIVDAVDYAALAGAAAKLTIDGKYLLIETLVEDLAALSLSRPHVKGVSVRVEKPQAVPAANTVGVEIYRATEA